MIPATTAPTRVDGNVMFMAFPCLLRPSRDESRQNRTLASAPAKPAGRDAWRGPEHATIIAFERRERESTITGARRSTFRAVRRSSSPDRRRIRLRRWIRLVEGILNAKAAVACAGQLALRPRCEPAVLGATTPPPAKVSAPRIDNHGATWPYTCCQCKDDPSHQTNDV